MTHNHISEQFGFDALLLDANEQNEARMFERDTAHLPSTMDEAWPFFRPLLNNHDAAMRAADIERVFALRGEARKLALRLNGGKPGILAGDDAPASI